MEQLKIFIDLTRLNKPIGFMLLFWPCSWGLAYALYYEKNTNTFFYYLILFFFGSVLMRSAGCIFNDIVDRLDEDNEFKKRQNFVGHSDISYVRKQDPGEKFPWKLLAQNHISIWHNLKDKELKKLRGVNTSRSEKMEFVNNLKKIGYKINLNQKNYNKLFRTFQRILYHVCYLY